MTSRKKTFKAMKFSVDNETQSRLLQDALFKEGYGWGASYAKEHRYTNSTYIFTNTSGYLTHTNSHDWFIDSTSFEHRSAMSYIHNSNSPTVDKQDSQVTLVEVLGNLYNKKDLQLALSSLTRYKLEK